MVIGTIGQFINESHWACRTGSNRSWVRHTLPSCALDGPCCSFGRRRCGCHMERHGIFLGEQWVKTACGLKKWNTKLLSSWFLRNLQIYFISIHFMDIPISSMFRRIPPMFCSRFSCFSCNTSRFCCNSDMWGTLVVGVFFPLNLWKMVIFHIYVSLLEGKRSQKTRCPFCCPFSQDLASSPCPNPGPARATGRCQGCPSEGAALGFFWDSPSFFHHEICGLEKFHGRMDFLDLDSFWNTQ